MLAARVLKSAVSSNALNLVDANGRVHHLGTGDSRITIRLHDRRLHAALFLNPRLSFGEAYMDGRLTIEGGSLYDTLVVLTANSNVTGPLGWIGYALAPAIRRIIQANPIHRARRNVAHHYDLSRDLYALFLDSDLQYSCAYFPRAGMTLEEAQTAKKRHIAAKLMLRPGQRVLDIGCGWGGLALSLADWYGVDVTGITLSTEQLAVARDRTDRAGLSDRVRFELCDYRAVAGRFDRVVSVGMFEHVGAPNYGTFFGRVRDLLADDGVALIHSIGRSDGPGITNPWFRKYIFPGGYSPALSEVWPGIERAGLWATDVEILRLHYAETLRHWRERFAARRAEAAALYDERFCRMWEFYLAGAEISFRYQGHMVFQVQLATSMGAVPMTRDYMVHAEQASATSDERAA